MKKLILFFILIAGIFSAKAQINAQKAVWVTFAVPQMKCWECKSRLEKFLITETGPDGDKSVLQVIVNMYNATVRVQYVPDRITVDYLRTEIANAGYDADSIKANADTYKMLPPNCKRKEDGGGPQKGKACNVPPDER